MQPTFDSALEQEIRRRRKKPQGFFRDNDAIIAASTHELAQAQDPSNNIKALLHRGQAHARKEHWQPALEDYNAVLELKPENTDAWYYRGALFEKLMRLDEAIQDFSRVLSLDANHVMASYARASCRNRQGDLVQAIEDYTYALERDATAHSLHAAVNSSKGRSLDPKRRSAVDMSPGHNWHSSPGPTASQSLDLSGTQARLGAGSMAQAAPLTARAPQTQHQDPCGQDAAQLRGDKESDNSDLRPRMLLGDLGQAHAASSVTPHQPPTVSHFSLTDSLLLHQSAPAPAEPERHAKTAQRPSDLEPHGLQGSQESSHQPNRRTAVSQPPAGVQTGNECRGNGHPLIDFNGGDSRGAVWEHTDGPRNPHFAHQTLQRGGDDYHNPVAGVQGVNGVDGSQHMRHEDGSDGRCSPMLWGQGELGQSDAALRQRGSTGSLLDSWIAHQSGHVHRPDHAPPEQQGPQQESILAQHQLQHQGHHHQQQQQQTTEDAHLQSSPAGLAAQLERPGHDKGAQQSRVSRRTSYDAGYSTEEVLQARRRRQELDAHHARGLAFRKADDYRSAVQEYALALKVDPRHFKSFFNKGFSHDKLGEFEEAVDCYTAAVELEPSNSYAHYNRGITKDKMSDFAGAIEDFSTAIRLDSTSADFFHNRGFSYRKAGMLQEAIEDYTMAIQLSPNHCRAFYNRAFSHERLDHVDEAVQDYTRALELEPRNATAYHNRASLFERQGNLDQALQDFTSAIAVEPHCALSYNARGLLYQNLGELHKAQADFDQAINLSPETAEHFRNRGQCRRALNDLHGCIEDFDAALALDPQEVQCLAQRGHALRRLGKYEAAVQDYGAAIAASPGNVRLHNNRAYCLAKLGRFGEALHDYDAVLDLDPSNTHAAHNRAISLHKLGSAQLPDGEQGPVSHPLLDVVGSRRQHHRQGHKQQQQQEQEHQQHEGEQGVLQWGPEQQRELEQLQQEARQWEEEDRLMQQQGDWNRHLLGASQQQQLQAITGS